jgi:hypothetical protein
MTLDELYDHITHYVAHPHTITTKHDKQRACLILGAFQEFILDCVDEDNDVHTIQFDEYVDNQLNILEEK